MEIKVQTVQIKINRPVLLALFLFLSLPLITFSDEMKITLEDTFYIQLTGKIRENVPATVYEVDLFDTPIDTIKRLKSKGKKVICYFNGGAYENWREDRFKFKKKDIGKPMDNWAGEYWLDIRSEDVRKIMVERMMLAKYKGCDGVDVDNVDGYLHKTGFKLTYTDQLNYNRFLSNEAHKLGLLISLKNNLNQIKDLADYFDFAVNEECHYYNECHLLKPFIERGKAVFNIEYDEKYLKNPEKLCKKAKREGIKTIILPLKLDGSFVYSCDYGFIK